MIISRFFTFTSPSAEHMCGGVSVHMYAHKGPFWRGLTYGLYNRWQLWPHYNKCQQLLY